MRIPRWTLPGLAFLCLPSCLSMTGEMWREVTAGPARVGTAWLEVQEAHWHVGTNAPAFRYRVTNPDTTLAAHLPDAGWVVLVDRGDGGVLRRRMRDGETFTFALVRRQVCRGARWRAWTRGAGYYWNATVSADAPPVERLRPLPKGLERRVEVEHFVREPRVMRVVAATLTTPFVVVVDVGLEGLKGCGKLLSFIDWEAVGRAVGETVGRVLLEFLGRAILHLINPLNWIGSDDDDDDDDDRRSSRRRRRGGSPKLGKPRRARR